MKHKFKIKYFLFIIIFGIFCRDIKLIYATVFLDENFDNWLDLYADMCPPSPWCTSCGCNDTLSPIVRDSTSHYNIEVNSPGHGDTGKSLKMPRFSDVWQGLDGGISIRPDGLGSPETSVISIRWYMLVPVDLDYTNMYNQKLFRFNISDGAVFYLNIYGNGHLRYCPNGTGDDCFEEDVASSATWHDGLWHSHELMFDIANQHVSYWLDGVETYNKQPINMGGIPISATFGDGANFMQHFPMGNFHLGSYYQSTWQSLDVDDLVIADEYIGPLNESSDTTPPALPGGLSVR